MSKSYLKRYEKPDETPKATVVEEVIPVVETEPVNNPLVTIHTEGTEQSVLPSNIRPVEVIDVEARTIQGGEPRYRSNPKCSKTTTTA